MSYSLDFEIPGLPLLPNELQRAHWSRVSRHAKSWHTAVLVAVGRDRPPRTLPRAKVTLTRHSTQRPDEDNLMASWKPAIDGLIHAKVIVDDKPQNLELVSQWTTAPRSKGKISVRVEEA